MYIPSVSFLFPPDNTHDDMVDQCEGDSMMSDDICPEEVSDDTIVTRCRQTSSDRMSEDKQVRRVPTFGFLSFFTCIVQTTT